MLKKIGQLLRGRVGWILRILVTAALFYVIFRYLVKPQEFVQALSKVIFGWLIVATLVKALGIFCSMLRWDLLLRAQGIRVPFSHLVSSFLVGRFFGMFTPSTLGLDIYRAYDIARSARDTVGSVAVIAVEKVTGFFTLSLLILATLPAGLRFLPGQVLLAVGLIFCLPVGLAFLLLLRPGLFERALRWNFPGKARVERKLRDTVAAITAYRDHQGYLWLAVLLGLVVHGATAWMYYFTALAVQANVSLGDMLFVGPLIIAATVIGPVVAGLAAREFTSLALLQLVGIARGEALLVGHLGFWCGEALPVILGGLILALRPASYRPAIERTPRIAAEETAPEEQLPAGPPPTLWKDCLLPGMAAGTLGAVLVGVGEVIALAVTEGSTNLVALPYGVILYAILGLLGGAVVGLLTYWIGQGLRPADPAGAASRWSLGLILVGMGGLVVRYRLIRDVFQEHLRTFSAMGILVHGALLIGGTALLVLVLFLSRRVQRTRAGSFLARGGVLLIVLVLLGAGLLTAALVRPAAPQPAPRPIPEALRDKPNVIVIGVDTLRADRLSCYGYAQQTSPRIDALAAEGVRYRTAVAQSSWTKPSFATIFSSLYPSSHTAIYKASRLPQDAVTLAEVLQQGGYTTGGIADSINIAPSFGFGQGFDTYNFLQPDYPLWASAPSSELAFYQAVRQVYAALTGNRVVVQEYYQDAATVTQVALDWLKAHRDERFFLFVHYMDPHDPYMEHPYNGRGYPRAGNQNPDPSMASTYSQLYDGEIRYLDEYLGQLLDWLKQAGLYENSLIVLTADHGEEFQEHAGWWHGETLYEEQLRVPLIVKFPNGARAGMVAEDPARSLDIAPTIVAMAGLTIPDTWQGRDLLGATKPPAYFFAEEDFEGNIIRSVQQGNYKLILANRDNPRGLPPMALFDLSNDPGEQTNRDQQEVGWVNTLREVLQQAQVEALSRRLQAEQGSIDAAAAEQLRKLGY